MLIKFRLISSVNQETDAKTARSGHDRCPYYGSTTYGWTDQNGSESYKVTRQGSIWAFSNFAGCNLPISPKML
jgi:hypothetical protein